MTGAPGSMYVASCRDDRVSAHAPSGRKRTKPRPGAKRAQATRAPTGRHPRAAAAPQPRRKRPAGASTWGASTSKLPPRPSKPTSAAASAPAPHECRRERPEEDPPRAEGPGERLEVVVGVAAAMEAGGRGEA